MGLPAARNHIVSKESVWNVTMITTYGLRMATTFILTVFIILEAGCNNVLGYTQTNCHGKNVSYHRTRGIYTQPHLKYGYNFIATIPSSARNISVSQHRLTSNHIALMKNDGSYIINGNWVLDRPGNFIDCGTFFTYHQNQDGAGSMKEYVYSPGPLNQPIQLLLLAYEVNGGITYEYDTPIGNASSSNLDDLTNDAALMSKNSFIQHRVNHDRNNTIVNEDVSTNRRRHWQKHYIWKTCYKSCGDTTYETAVCVHHSTEMIVPEKQCSTLQKPMQEDYRCNTTSKPCLPEWVPSEWSPCSMTCGEGVRVREVACKQLSSSGYPMILHGKACSTLPPPTVQKCHLKVCDAVTSTKTWDVGQWSKCSSSCGEGFRTRTVTCRSTFCHPDDVPTSKESCYSVCPTQGMWLASQWSTKASKVEMQPSINKYCTERCGSGWQMRNVICFGDKECSSIEQPKIYRACKSDESCSGQWFTGPWQMCSGVCDEGNQKRDIVCLGKVQNEFVSVPEHNCKPEEKPVPSQRCKLPDCSATWYTTEWSTCTKSCGGGVQYRKVYCVKKNLESTLCPETEKPPKSQTCNTHLCTTFIKDTDCVDKHKYCQKAVVQARLCNYSYYKNLCCQSCSHKN
ncbi:thrombospondin type-1 domain-containing protein 4 isoform X3 [Halyomorpha halys]|uniref:thrombospondin type-1 domain-containing protein 4 isoform X3 n=2 Tax=Halyomorpha halys TaxID=286706 RepID=UPI0006D5236E|nr:thrombospondin type-1 domain-containing protein 4 isoform X1 [Halyomorpha halys]